MNPYQFDENRHIAQLRNSAETQLARFPTTTMPDRPAEELLHELQVHQIELEMQNEELRRAHAAMEESRDRYLDLYEFAPICYLTLTRDGMIAGMNLTGAALFGVERNKLLSRRFVPLVSPQDRDRWHRLFMSVLRQEGRQRSGLRLQRPDGSLFHASLDCLRIEDAGKPAVVRIALTDITEREEAEQAIRDSQMRLFVEQAPIGIAMLDRDMNYIATSRRWIDEYGNGHSELIGRNHYEVHPDLSGEWKQVHRQALAGDIVKKEEDKWIQADGSELWLRWAVHPWLNAAAEVGGIIISAENITARKLAEQALRDADRRKDEFLAMLAHELRNPLAPIRNASHVLGQLGLEEPRVKWAQEIIESQVTHLTRMVDDLLDVSRIVRGKIELKKESVELTALVEQLVESVRPLAETKRHQLTVRLPEQSVWLEADPVRLFQALFNVIDNAVKYTPDGGQIEFDSHLADDGIEIRVRDNGTGIPATLLPRVFDLFQQDRRTLERAQGGLGIGLTLVQQLVGLHCGRVTAYSEGRGQGSTFTIWLPVRTAQPQALPSAAPVLPLPATGARVLVVDDDQYVADSTAVLLDLEGYEARVAATGRDALELIPDFRPQVVLLDIGLAGMDGFEIAERLRRLPEGRDLCLIAVTGYGDTETKEKALAAGCDHFVIKPMSWSVLGKLLAEVTYPGSPPG